MIIDSARPIRWFEIRTILYSYRQADKVAGNSQLVIFFFPQKIEPS